MNLIVLGAFNVEKRREDDALFGAFDSEGLTVLGCQHIGGHVCMPQVVRRF